MDPGDVAAVFLGLFQAGEVGVHDGLVPVEGEDQGDVDADALGDDGRDRGQPGQRGGDLDQHVGPIDDLGQFVGLCDSGGGVVRDKAMGLQCAERLAAWLSRQPGWRATAVMAAPIAGKSGNQEYFLAGRTR